MFIIYGSFFLSYGGHIERHLPYKESVGEKWTIAASWLAYTVIKTVKLAKKLKGFHKM